MYFSVIEKCNTTKNGPEHLKYVRIIVQFQSDANCFDLGLKINTSFLYTIQSLCLYKPDPLRLGVNGVYSYAIQLSSPDSSPRA